MKNVNILILLFFIAGCQQNPYKDRIASLEELPDSISTNLLPRRSDSLLIAVKPPVENPYEDTARVALAPRYCQTKVLHSVEVNYPITICDRLQIPGYIDQELTTQTKDGAQKTTVNSTASASAERVQVGYKLSKWKGQSYKRPVYCTTENGPWKGLLIETVECNGATTFLLEFEILKGDSVSLNWSYFLENHPNDLIIGTRRELSRYSSSCDPRGHTNCN